MSVALYRCRCAVFVRNNGSISAALPRDVNSVQDVSQTPAIGLQGYALTGSNCAALTAT